MREIRSSGSVEGLLSNGIPTPTQNGNPREELNSHDPPHQQLRVPPPSYCLMAICISVLPEASEANRPTVDPLRPFSSVRGIQRGRFHEKALDRSYLGACG